MTTTEPTNTAPLTDPNAPADPEKPTDPQNPQDPGHAHTDCSGFCPDGTHN